MKTSLNKQLIVGIAAGGTTLILLKGGDYKWLFLAGFVVTLFIFSYFYKKNEKHLGEFLGLAMEINWVILGWLIDTLLNGFVWLVIAAIFLTLIDLTDTWTRKVLKLMDKADIWIRKFVENLFEWFQKKNLKIIGTIILLIILGVLAQLEIIPKLIT